MYRARKRERERESSTKTNNELLSCVASIFCLFSPSPKRKTKGFRNFFFAVVLWLVCVVCFV